MTRPLTPGHLVIATHNPGKVREIAALVAPHGIAPVSAGDLGLAEPAEDGATFIANAVIKAMAAATASGMPALADDSGLVVDALKGAPGVHSADWAEAPDGPKGSSAGARDFGRAMERVRREWLAAGPAAPDTARFVCALALAWPDGHVETFEGVVEGRLVWPPRGTRGFGYDPMFVAEGQALTFGEMEPEAKHAISHRADAFRQLAAACLP
jgi:XTP/dITP diphosphohydrolase